MGLFDKKAGGTFVGNLIRAAASNLTGGIAGQGANKINSDGTYGNGTESNFWTDLFASVGGIGAQTPQGQEIIQDSSAAYAKSKLINNSIWIAIVAILGGLVIYLSINKK